MRKKYILNARQNSSSIILAGKGGIRVRFDFTNGSVIQNQPASFITENKFYQDLLENSEYVRKGVIKLAQVFKTENDAVKEAPAKDEEAKVVPGIKSAKDAIEWVADTFGVKVTSGRAASEYAKKQGYILQE
jgi:hypothetical protein